MLLRKKLFLLLTTILSLMSSSGQLKPVYDFQKDDTLIKRSFYNKSLALTELQLNALKNIDKETKEQYKRIFYERLDEIKDLLLSSRSVTNLSTHNYLQSVLTKITDANPELKNMEIRLLFTRDWWPNAYSVGDGTLAVNAGLFLYLNNEAELAFILCHELAHYYLDHSGKAIKKYIETVSGAEFKAEMKRIAKLQTRQNQAYDQLLKKSVFDNRRHTRDKEAEADKWAMQFLRNTGYAGIGAKNALQKLDTLDEAAFITNVNLKQFFSFESYPFKDKWIKTETSIFSELSDEDASGLTQKERDSLKTHPDCLKRIELINEAIKNINGKLFLVNESKFNQIRKDFKAEIVDYCFATQKLSRHLYYCLQMIDDPQYRPLALLGIARTLNNIYQAQKDHKVGNMIDIESRHYPKDYNLLLRMLSRIRLEEILNINYLFCKNNEQEMKDYTGFNEELKLIEKNKH